MLWRARFTRLAHGWNRSRVRPSIGGNGSQVAGGIGRGTTFNEGFDSRVPSPARGDRSQVAGEFRGSGSRVVEIAGGMSRRSCRKLLEAAETVHKSAYSWPCFEVRQGDWVAGGFFYVVDTTEKMANFHTPILLPLSLSFKTYPWSVPPRPRRCRSTLPRKHTRAAPFADAAGRAVAPRVEPPTASSPFGLRSFPRQCSAAACGLRQWHPCGVPPIKSAPLPPDRGPCGATLLEGRTSRLVVFDDLHAGACVRRATLKIGLGRFSSRYRLSPESPGLRAKHGMPR